MSAQSTINPDDYVSTVNVIASRMCWRLPACVDKRDMVSAGGIGLMRSIGRVDADEVAGSRSGSVCAYLESGIRGAMFDELRTQDYASRHTRKMESRRVKAAQRIAGRGLRPTVELVDAELGWATKRSDSHRTAMNNVDAATKESLCRRVEADIAPTDLDEHENIMDQRSIIVCALRALLRLEKTRPRDVDIWTRYRMGTRLMRELGEDHGVTESRVSQLVREVDGYLRRAVAAMGPEYMEYIQ